MKTGSGTNVWYLLVLIALAIVFIFAGVKYLGSGEVDHNQNQNNQSATDNNPTNPQQQNDTTLSQDQQYAADGAKAMDKGDYSAAIDYFSKAIAANPNNTSYYSLKSQAEVLAGQTDQAKSTLESGLKVSPNDELLNSKLDVLNNSANLTPADQDNPRL